MEGRGCCCTRRPIGGWHATARCSCCSSATARRVGAGRRARTINRRLRRALQRRSRGTCEWPRCVQRRHLQEHHLWHWEDGGPIELWNLTNLCWTHHHAVHDLRFRVVLDEGVLRAFRPDGSELAAAPSMSGPLSR